jgi:diacylglycerol kinase family enzyme
MHNPKAGDARHGKKELMKALADAGHHAIYQSTKENDWKKALKKETDLIVAAGGDGTVGKVAAKLIDTGIPLSVLPLGTANNLARSLGFTVSPDEIIEQLEKGHKQAFDVGKARWPRGKRYVFEGVGAGLLADYVAIADEKEKKRNKKTKNASKEQELIRHVTLLRRMLHDYPVQKWKIEIDGKSITDRYILWEAMNIRSVGPGLYLAPWAATKDGEFDFVGVREEDRALLLEHLDARLAGKKSKFPLPMRKFRDLRIIWEKGPIHLDDEPWPGKNGKRKRSVKIKVTVKPSALVILRPLRNSNHQSGICKTRPSGRTRRPEEARMLVNS